MSTREQRKKMIDGRKKMEEEEDIGWMVIYLQGTMHWGVSFYM